MPFVAHADWRRVSAALLEALRGGLEVANRPGLAGERVEQHV